MKENCNDCFQLDRSRLNPAPGRFGRNTSSTTMSRKRGQTAGIDPVSGCIWFGDSVQDVVAQRDAAGYGNPLYLVRVGYETYYRKGGHHRPDHDNHVPRPRSYRSISR